MHKAIDLALFVSILPYLGYRPISIEPPGRMEACSQVWVYFA